MSVGELWLVKSRLVFVLSTDDRGKMSGTITALVAQKKNKDRVNVYLDGRFAFGLAAVEAIKLKRGQVLSDADTDRLRDADEAEKAHEKALRFLANRPRSESEVHQNLIKAKFGSLAIDQAIERLRQSDLINDEAFVRYWIENRSQFNPRGQRALRQELRQKGVAREAIDAVLETTGHDEDEAATQAALAKANRYKDLPQPEFKQKLGAYLMRRGFDYETVRQAVAAAWQSVHSDNEDSSHLYPSDELEE